MIDLLLRGLPRRLSWSPGACNDCNELNHKALPGLFWLFAVRAMPVFVDSGNKMGNLVSNRSQAQDLRCKVTGLPVTPTGKTRRTEQQQCLLLK